MILARKKLKYRRQTCPRATVSTTNFIWAGLELNLGLCGKKLVTNHLNHGTAYNFTASNIFTGNERSVGKGNACSALLCHSANSEKIRKQYCNNNVQQTLTCRHT
jgi:hypothetical protein